MKSPTEIHSDSAIELQVYHLIKCYHNFCIMSLLSKQQSFPLQVKRICRDSSFVTLMSFCAKLSSQIFLSLFRIPRQNSQGAIHSTKISGNFGPKLNGSVRSNRKSFEKTGPPFEVVLFSRSDRSEFWLNGSRPQLFSRPFTYCEAIRHVISVES